MAKKPGPKPATRQRRKSAEENAVLKGGRRTTSARAPTPGKAAASESTAKPARTGAKKPSTAPKHSVNPTTAKQSTRKPAERSGTRQQKTTASKKGLSARWSIARNLVAAALTAAAAALLYKNHRGSKGTGDTDGADNELPTWDASNADHERGGSRAAKPSGPKGTTTKSGRRRKTGSSVKAASFNTDKDGTDSGSGSNLDKLTPGTRKETSRKKGTRKAALSPPPPVTMPVDGEASALAVAAATAPESGAGTTGEATHPKSPVDS
jgi:hypothetical protein